MSDINGVNTPSPTLARLTSPVTPSARPRYQAPTIPRLSQPRRIKFADIAPTVSKQGGGGDESFSLGDIVSIVPSVLRGVGSVIQAAPTFIGQAAQTALGAGKYVLEGLVDNPIRGTALSAALGQPEVDVVPFVDYTSRLERDLAKADELGLTGLERLQYATQRQLPLVGQLATSYAGGGKRLAELVPFAGADYGEPGVDYFNALKSGDLGALLLEDIGNVVLAGRATGLGNVGVRAGGALTQAGLPRTGRVVSGVSRLADEPVGTTARVGARLSAPLARTAGLTRTAESLGRIGATATPFRQTVTEVRDVRANTARLKINEALTEVARLNNEIVNRQARGATEPELATLRAQVADQERIITDNVNRLPETRQARQQIRQSQIETEAERTNISAEAARLINDGIAPETVETLRQQADALERQADAGDPNADYLREVARNRRELADLKEANPEAVSVPVSEQLQIAANIVFNGPLANYIVNAVERGVSFTDLARLLTPPETLTSTAFRGYRATPEAVESVYRYMTGASDALEKASIDRVRLLYSAFSQRFTGQMLAGEGATTGAMPYTYLLNNPEPKFLLTELAKMSDATRTEVLSNLNARMAAILATADEATLEQLGLTPDDLPNAWVKMAEMDYDTPGFQAAYQLLADSFGELRQNFPDVFENPLVYPRNVRPTVFAQRAEIREAQAQDVAMILGGLNDIVSRTPSAIPEALRTRLNNLLTKLPEPGQRFDRKFYEQVVRTLNQVSKANQTKIAKLTGDIDKLTDQQRIELEALQQIEQVRADLTMMLEAVETRLGGVPRLRTAEEEIAFAETGVPSARLRQALEGETMVAGLPQTPEGLRARGFARDMELGDQATVAQRALDDKLATLAVLEAQLQGLQTAARLAEEVAGIEQATGRLRRVTETTEQTVFDEVEVVPTPEPPRLAPSEPVLTTDAPAQAGGEFAPGQPLGLRADEPQVLGYGIASDLEYSKTFRKKRATEGLGRDEARSFPRLFTIGGVEYVVTPYHIVPASELQALGIDVATVGFRNEDVPAPMANDAITKLLNSTKGNKPARLLGVIESFDKDAAAQYVVILVDADGVRTAINLDMVAPFMGRSDVSFTTSPDGTKPVGIKIGKETVGVVMPIRQDFSGFTDDQIAGVVKSDSRNVAPSTNPLAVALHKRGLWLVGLDVDSRPPRILVLGNGATTPQSLPISEVVRLTGVAEDQFGDLPRLSKRTPTGGFTMPETLSGTFRVENEQAVIQRMVDEATEITDTPRLVDPEFRRINQETIDTKPAKDTLAQRINVALVDLFASGRNGFVNAPATKSAKVTVSDTPGLGTVYFVRDGKVYSTGRTGRDVADTVATRRADAEQLGAQRFRETVAAGLPETIASPPTAPRLGPIEATPTPAVAPTPTIERVPRTVTTRATRLVPTNVPMGRYPAGRRLTNQLNAMQKRVDVARNEAQRAQAKLDRLNAKAERLGSETPAGTLSQVRQRSVFARRAEPRERLAEERRRLRGLAEVSKEGKTRPLTKVTRKLQSREQQAVRAVARVNEQLKEVRDEHALREQAGQGLEEVAGTAEAVSEVRTAPFGPQLTAPGERTGYLPGGLSSTVLATTAPGVELRTPGAAPQIQGAFEQTAETAARPLTLAETANRINQIMNQQARNKIVEDILQNPQVTTNPATLLGEDAMNRIIEQATRMVEADTRTVRTPAEIQRAIKLQIGIMLVDAVDALGYEPVSAVKVNVETGQHAATGDLLGVVEPGVVDGNTFLMRKGLRERIGQEYVSRVSSVPEGVSKALRKLQRGTASWKSYILAPSLRWQVGDAVSNILFAWVRGDVPPRQLFAQVRDTFYRVKQEGRRMTDAFEGTINDPALTTLFGAGLQARGLRMAETMALRSGGDPRLGVADFEMRGPMKRFRTRAFKVNEFNNGMFRSSTAMVKLQRLLEQQGRTMDEVTPELYATDPVIRDAVNETVRTTNEALGAFSELTPFEKNVMRQIYAFWSWLKFSNKAAAQLAIDNPDRVLFALALGSLATDPDDNQFFDWLRGKTPVGGFLVDLSFINPYQDALIFGANPLTEFGETLSGVSPVITTPIRALDTVIYYGSGRSFLPFGSMQRPGYLEGRPGATTRTFGDLLGELGYMGLQTFAPPLRNVLQLGPSGTRIPGTDVALGPVQRYPQGSPRTTGAYAEPRLGPVAGRLSAIGRTFGLPMPLAQVSRVNEQAAEQAQRDRAARLRRIQERQASLR